MNGKRHPIQIHNEIKQYVKLEELLKRFLKHIDSEVVE